MGSAWRSALEESSKLGSLEWAGCGTHKSEFDLNLFSGCCSGVSRVSWLGSGMLRRMNSRPRPAVSIYQMRLSCWFAYRLMLGSRFGGMSPEVDGYRRRETSRGSPEIQNSCLEVPVHNAEKRQDGDETRMVLDYGHYEGPGIEGTGGDL